MMFLHPNWIIGFVFAYCFWMGGGLEARQSGRRNPGPYWALASILVTAGVIQGLGGGVFFVILAQALLFIAIAAWRVTFEK